MSVTLSKGFKKPVAPDPGSTWMPEHEGNIVQLNDHSHDGVDSELLTLTLLGRDSVTAPSGSWSAVAAGYEQTVSAPAAVSEINNHALWIHDSSGKVVFPTIERITSTTFKLTTNDNTETLTIRVI